LWETTRYVFEMFNPMRMEGSCSSFASMEKMKENLQNNSEVSLGSFVPLSFFRLGLAPMYSIKKLLQEVNAMQLVAIQG
jgi:hypothetical protein